MRFPPNDALALEPNEKTDQLVKVTEVLLPEAEAGAPSGR